MLDRPGRPDVTCRPRAETRLASKSYVAAREIRPSTATARRRWDDRPTCLFGSKGPGRCPTRQEERGAMDEARVWPCKVRVRLSVLVPTQCSPRPIFGQRRHRQVSLGGALLSGSRSTETESARRKTLVSEHPSPPFAPGVIPWEEPRYRSAPCRQGCAFPARPSLDSKVLFCPRF